MWRDPLDELIEELERTAPAAPLNAQDAIVQVQEITDAILYSTPEEADRLLADPRYQRCFGTTPC